MDMIGAFISFHGLKVAQMAHDGIVIHDAVCSQQIGGSVGALQGNGHVILFQHRNVGSFRLARVFELRHVIGKQLALSNFGNHPGEFLLPPVDDALKVYITELLAGERILRAVS